MRWRQYAGKYPLDLLWYLISSNISSRFAVEMVATFQYTTTQVGTSLRTVPSLELQEKAPPLYLRLATIATKDAVGPLAPLYTCR
jgi:hypothetical protein